MAKRSNTNASRAVSRNGGDTGARKRGGLASSGAIDSRALSVDGAKGGGERWLKMASAMDTALDRMRIMWELIDRLQALHAESGCNCAQHSGNWTPLKNEVTAVANVLKTGLKARDYEQRP